VADNSNQPNANVQQHTDNNSSAQRWKLDLIEAPIVSGGLYRLTHKGTNQCLDVAGNSNLSGANVQQYTNNTNDAQRWYITLESDGHYKLRHKGTAMVLDVAGNSSTAGANVQQYNDLGSDAQRWKIDLVSGYFKLTHKGTTQCLDVSNNSSEPGTNVGQWNDGANNDAQRWKLDLMPDVNPVNGSGDGLTGHYFNGKNFETQVLSRNDAAVNFDWADGSPAASVNPDMFSARWTGQLQPRYSGDYTFYITNDDGGRLWVNNQLIINKWTDDGGATVYGKIQLNAGQKYDIRMEYYENAYGAKAKVEWSSVLQVREVVPTSQLYASAISARAVTPEKPSSEEDTIDIYPVPGNGNAPNDVTILLPPSSSVNVSLHVMDPQGKQVMSKQYPVIDSKISLTIPAVSSGLYLIRINDSKRAWVKKYIVR
jgi:hypothetical protein